MTHSEQSYLQVLKQRSDELRSYVGLDEPQIAIAKAIWPLVEPDLDLFVEDFYNEILKHEQARRVIKSPEQVMRLKGTLRSWITDLFTSEHDVAFIARRRAVGLRHVQIGLDAIWVSAAMSRLRDQIIQSAKRRFPADRTDFAEVSSALARLMDLDLAIIQDAYHAESVAKRIAHERDFAEGVIETAQAVVMVVGSDGQIVRGNQFLAKRLGRNEPITSATLNADDNCLDMIAAHQRSAFSQFMAKAAAGESPEPLETLLLVNDGPAPHIRWHATRYDDQQATRPLVLCVGQDITELTDAQSRLVRSERLAAIGQTMAGLAHESRNAFQRSQAALETLGLELEDRPDAVRLVERIQRAHDHLLHLYEEVLQFARPVRLELQTVQLNGLLNQTWDHIRQASSEKPVRFEIQATPGGELSADPFALEQVFRNLLENAIEASARDGVILVALREAWMGVDRCVEVCVRDFGKGMSDEAVSRAFEPFFTTRSRGTGLGLPIARRLVEAHGGTLELRRAQPGIAAIVTLPLHARPVEFIDATIARDMRRPLATN